MGMTRMNRRAFIGAVAAASLSARVRAKTDARVIIAGGGFSGASCALQLRRLAPSIDVTLIDPDDRYVSCPMSNGVLAGWRSIDSLTVTREGLRRAGVRVVRDRVVAIDADAYQVRLENGAPREFDRLVVAPGIRFLWNSPEGYDEAAARHMPHAWIAGAQTTLLARQIAEMRTGGVVAIGVPAGFMRCPPGPFERASVIAAFLKRRNPRAKILIFDSNNHFPKQDVFTAAWQELYPGMIDWIAPMQGGNVERIDVDKSTLYTSRGAQRVDVANIIPPQAPGQIAVDAGLASGHGWCPVDAATFESTRLRHVHVIGDACIAGAMPKSASAAHSQATQCAQAIVASFDGRVPAAPRFDSVCYSALARDRALSIHGSFGVIDGAIAAIDTPPAPASRPQDEAVAADQWFSQLVAASFGT